MLNPTAYGSKYHRAMPRRSDDDRVPRVTARLSREAIVAAGIALADRDGLDGLSMRRLAQELGVNPMSLYHHVRDKDALLEAMIDTVVAEIAPDHEAQVAAREVALVWTEELRRLILEARRTMLAHSWAVPVLQQGRPPTPATLRHLDRLLAAMRRGGCSVGLGHHALHLLGSRMLGFSQDLFIDAPQGGPGPATPTDPALGAVQFRALAELYPNVADVALAASHDGGLGGCDDDAEFGFALDVLVDAIERRSLAAGSRSTDAPGDRRADHPERGR
jgi:AcrR family transcriptional regulator